MLRVLRLPLRRSDVRVPLGRRVVRREVLRALVLRRRALVLVLLLRLLRDVRELRVLEVLDVLDENCRLKNFRWKARNCAWLPTPEAICLGVATPLEIAQSTKDCQSCH